MRCLVAIVCALVVMPGCRSTTSDAGTTKTSGDLPSLIEHHVHLEGRFGGPGKFGDYVALGDTQIYLTGKPDSGGRAVAYGSMVAVEGTLRYQEYSDTTPAQENRPLSRPPDHFYIDQAVIRVIEAP